MSTPAVEDAAGRLSATLRHASERLLTTGTPGAREIFLAAELSELETDLTGLRGADHQLGRADLVADGAREAMIVLARDPRAAGLAGRLQAALERAGVL